MWSWLKFIVSGLVALAVPYAYAADKPDLIGVWVLNAEESQELVKEKSGGDGVGGIRPSISIGGIGIPLPGGRAAPAPSGGKRKDPDVLFCQELEIAFIDEEVVVNYAGLGEDRMKPGSHQGRKVRWSLNKLSQRYETTSRKVDKKFKLTGPDRMLVTVTLNPAQGSTRVFKKVFDRR